MYSHLFTSWSSFLTLSGLSNILGTAFQKTKLSIASTIFLVRNPRGLHWDSSNGACHRFHKYIFVLRLILLYYMVCCTVWLKRPTGLLYRLCCPFLLCAGLRVVSLPCYLVRPGEVFLGMECVASRIQRSVGDCVHFFVNTEMYETAILTCPWPWNPWKLHWSQA
jgi:hypothetical protein